MSLQEPSQLPPVSSAPQEQKLPAGVPVPSKASVRRPWYRSNKVWTWVAVLFFLMGVASLVPAGKIPFLRNLVYAMGYSPDDADKISFLKALLSWNEHGKLMQGQRPEADELSAFSGRGSAMTTGQMQNKLIDIRSVNAALAKQGRRGDLLAGAYSSPSDIQNNTSSVKVAKSGVAANTQANGAKNAAVFFGEDSASIRRDKDDAFNSVNTLKKVTNKPVAGFAGEDWLGRLVDKAVSTETDLSDFAKTLDRSGSSLAQVGAVGKLGDSRAMRDMYYAWLTGRAGRRAPQPALKKTLASASFDGAEMPRTVFSASGFSGVGIKPDDVVGDMDSVKKFFELDKQCQHAISEGFRLSPPTDELRQQITGLADSFPATCGARYTSQYPSNLRSISNRCDQMKGAFEQVQRGCSTIALELSDSQCHSETLTTYYSAFDAFCREKEQQCRSAGDPAAVQACLANVAGTSSSQNYAEPGSNIMFNAGQLSQDANHIFYDSDERLNTDFFPGVNWGQSLWVDSDAAD